MATELAILQGFAYTLIKNDIDHIQGKLGSHKQGLKEGRLQSTDYLTSYSTCISQPQLELSLAQAYFIYFLFSKNYYKTFKVAKNNYGVLK